MFLLGMESNVMGAEQQFDEGKATEVDGPLKRTLSFKRQRSHVPQPSNFYH